MEKKGYKSLINMTDKEINEKIEIKVNDQYNITNRAIYRGGRTEYYQNYHKWNNNQRILKGMDLTSLYPSMML